MTHTIILLIVVILYQAQLHGEIVLLWGWEIMKEAKTPILVVGLLFQPNKNWILFLND